MLEAEVGPRHRYGSRGFRVGQSSLNTSQVFGRSPQSHEPILDIFGVMEVELQCNSKERRQEERWLYMFV